MLRTAAKNGPSVLGRLALVGVHGHCVDVAAAAGGHEPAQHPQPGAGEVGGEHDVRRVDGLQLLPRRACEPDKLAHRPGVERAVDLVPDLPVVDAAAVADGDGADVRAPVGHALRRRVGPALVVVRRRRRPLRRHAERVEHLLVGSRRGVHVVVHPAPVPAARGRLEVRPAGAGVPQADEAEPELARPARERAPLVDVHAEVGRRHGRRRRGAAGLGHTVERGVGDLDGAGRVEGEHELRRRARREPAPDRVAAPRPREDDVLVGAGLVPGLGVAELEVDGRMAGRAQPDRGLVDAAALQGDRLGEQGTAAAEPRDRDRLHRGAAAAMPGVAPHAHAGAAPGGVVPGRGMGRELASQARVAEQLGAADDRTAGVRRDPRRRREGRCRGRGGDEEHGGERGPGSARGEDLQVHPNRSIDRARQGLSSIPPPGEVRIDRGRYS